MADRTEDREAKVAQDAAELEDQREEAKRFSDFLFVSGAMLFRDVDEPPTRDEVKQAYAEEVAERRAARRKRLSPFPGVKWRSKVRRWAADGREGTFPDELQAAAAYEEGVARQDVEEARRAAREASRARRELEVAASPRQGDLAQLG